MKKVKEMIKKITVVALFIGFIGLISKTSYADEASKEPKKTLAQYFDEEVLSMDHALEGASAETTMISDHNVENEGYFFRRFWFRSRPRVERDIPWLAGFSVIAELELLFEKQTPEGWEIYKVDKKK